MNLTTVEIKAYLPSSDIQTSGAFYVALGFDVQWMSENMAYVQYGSTSFLLQKFYVKEHAENFMMHMLVENVDDWYRHVILSGVRERFGTQVGIAEDRPWGIRDFTLVDPASVLWRIGQELRP